MRAKKQPPRWFLELHGYGRFKWVPVVSIEAIHQVKSVEHFAGLFEKMDRVREWRGRPLLVERVKPGVSPPGIEWYSWTGSHRVAAAFAAQVWAVPIIEINLAKWDRVHGAPPRGEARVQATYDDETRLAMLMETGDQRAIRLMQKEVPKNYWEDPKPCGIPWTRTGPHTRARARSSQVIELENDEGQSFEFSRRLLEKLCGLAPPPERKVAQSGERPVRSRKSPEGANARKSAA